MNLELVATSAVAAGIVSAFVNAAFGWIRLRAEAHQRRQEDRRSHLREAVADFLGAEIRMHDYGVAAEEAYAEISGSRISGAWSEAHQRLARRDEKQFSRLYFDASDEVDNAIGRMRLYSQDLDTSAEQLSGSRLTSKVEDKEDRESALVQFLEVARTELGIQNL